MFVYIVQVLIYIHLSALCRCWIYICLSALAGADLHPLTKILVKSICLGVQL